MIFNKYGGMDFPRDLHGNPVARTKFSHRYSYDPFVQWKGEYHEDKSKCVYSDRLMQQNYDKFNKCCMKAFGNEGQYFSQREPADIERFLSEYFGKEIILTAIIEGCNVSNGYPYWIFYFEER